MNDLDELKALLDDLDDRLAAIEEPEPVEGEVVGAHFQRRAEGAPALEAVAADASSALERFPLCTPLLCRRAEAFLRIVTPEGDSPRLEEAEADLRNVLEIDPDHVGAGTLLLNGLFVHSGLDDADVAAIAGSLAEKAQGWLEELVSIQISAHAYADAFGEADALLERWDRIFPGSDVLGRARRDVNALRGS